MDCESGGAEIVKVYRGNPIVSNPLSNPTRISTQTVHKKNKQGQTTREEEIYLKIMMTTCYKRSNGGMTKRTNTRACTEETKFKLYVVF